MDFLEIRRKAKERAAAKAAEAERARADDPKAARGDSSAARGDSSAARGEPVEPRAAAPVVNAALAEPAEPRAADPVVDAARGEPVDARAADPVAAFPVPPEPAAGGEERFWTWRPGAGEPSPAPAEPRDEAPAPAPAPPAAPRPPADPLDDFFWAPDEPGPPIPELEAPEAPSPFAAGPEAREEYLTFFLGDEEYAVAIEHVREVVKAPAITEVPRAPADVVGVVSVRGDVVAVFEPRQRLALPPSEAGGGRIVIVDAGEGPCGLLVDRVASVVRLPRGRIEPCPQGIAAQNADCIAGVGREHDRIFTVLDVPALVRTGRRGEGRAHAAGR